MSSKTKIEWAANADGTPGATWNPIRARVKETGRVGSFCVHVSAGCINCYAEDYGMRTLPKNGTGLAYTAQNLAKVDIFLDEKMLYAPLRRQKPTTYFLSSMTDAFGEFVSDGIIMLLWNVMFQCPQHTFIVVTKRAKRMREFVTKWCDLDGEDFAVHLARGPDETRAKHPSGRGLLFAAMLDEMLVLAGGDVPDGAAFPTFDWMGGQIHWPNVAPNIWLVVSCEDQENANERIPHLLATPAAARGVSAEPLIGPIDLNAIDVDEEGGDGWRYDALAASYWFRDDLGKICTGDGPPLATIDWVIVGGESGRNARPMHPQWARALRDQCEGAGVPFFFKQWGEWLPGAIYPPESETGCGAVHFVDGSTEFNGEHVEGWPDMHVPAPPECPVAAFFAAERAKLAPGATLVLRGAPDRDHAATCQREACRAKQACLKDGRPWMYVFKRVSKARAGRLLDGVEHNARPSLRNPEAQAEDFS
jgi:protein gp37